MMGLFDSTKLKNLSKHISHVNSEQLVTIL